ncbi:flavin reductase family protein [Nitratireductor sp. L1-7-SE]|uniref:Flavin reductase family protein n=1 Tax=Nitratireductor rhodophyticola TaxID=2854036 RepID=A0ABS7R7K2_9HYPH|nr:flavin reductase family protein [Nitratireductor rhodophyticola]MBY8916923.1 flavin reductase family protein [Nitratireductor rhodophyticola]MBY8920648.1 flavin reductase family protein [Nitratireductor rhodophyticola]
MRFKLDELDPQIGYKVMTATVTPRPIAWVTSVSSEGVVNAAPYSFFNLMGHRPPTVAIGVMADPQRGFKDTARNIVGGGEFVVNLVPERLAAAMNITSMDAPEDVSELDCAGLTALPAEQVAPPHIAEAPVSFECVSHSVLVTGPHQALVVGRVVEIRVADDFVIDAERGHIDTPALGLIARMHGRGWYARSSDTFQIDRPTYADWLAGEGRQVG